MAVLKSDVSMFPFQQMVFQESDGLSQYLLQAKALQLFEERADDSYWSEADTYSGNVFLWVGRRQEYRDSCPGVKFWIVKNFELL